MAISDGDMAILRGILDALREDPDEPANWAALRDIGSDIGGEAERWHRLSDTVGQRAAILRDAYEMAAPTRQGRAAINESNFHSGYAETGYDEPEHGIVATGNWNAITSWPKTGTGRQGEDIHERRTDDSSPVHFSETLEKMGVAIEWSDEWSTCDDCGKLVRLNANSYDWQPSYVYGQDDDPESGEFICLQCRDRHAVHDADPDEEPINEDVEDDLNGPPELVGTNADGTQVYTQYIDDQWYIVLHRTGQEDDLLGPYPNYYIVQQLARNHL